MKTLALLVATISGYIAVTCTVNYLALPIFIIAIIVIKYERGLA